MANETEERISRRLRRSKLYDAGLDPYPARVTRTHTCVQVLSTFEVLEREQMIVTLVGRVRTLRKHGGSAFAHMQDGTERVQIYLKRDVLGVAAYDLILEVLDLGDFIEATGKVYRTQRGEKSLLVEKIRIISKSLEPLPEKWHGLSDVEIRYRKRYLDLLSNPQVTHIFKKRSNILQAIRTFLEKEGFSEVETPILQQIPGGALARPFRTHHHALDTDLFLRVAPELFLKRLIVGGMERVYEIARCFRNEGIDHAHNPEFTQVEFYAAYVDYMELMRFFEGMFEYVVTTVAGETNIEFEGNRILCNPPFARKTFTEALQEYGKIDIDALQDERKLAEALRARGVEISGQQGRAKLLDEALKTLVRPHLIQPTFLYRYPIELSPLAKKTEDDPRYVERFQLFCGSVELANAFSEINDPTDQDERFTQQQESRERGDEETHQKDSEFVSALNYGMPPTAGLGMGIDRLTNILTNTHSIKEVILFPTLKPKHESPES